MCEHSLYFEVVCPSNILSIRHVYTHMYCLQRVSLYIFFSCFLKIFFSEHVVRQ